MYGETVKQIREAKNLSLKAVYTGICSKTNAIAFEKGERMLAADKFSEVLANLMVTTEEFHWIENGYRPAEKDYRLYLMRRSWNAQELEKFEQQLKSIERSETVTQVWLASYRLLNAYGQKRPLDEHDLGVVVSYFTRLSSWTLEDIHLFASNCYTLPYDLMLGLLNEALKVQKRYAYYKDSDKIFATVLVNCLEEVFNQGDLLTASELLEHLKEFTGDITMLGFKLFEKYYQARLIYQGEDQARGKKELQKIYYVAEVLEDQLVMNEIKKVIS